MRLTVTTKVTNPASAFTSSKQEMTDFWHATNVWLCGLRVSMCACLRSVCLCISVCKHLFLRALCCAFLNLPLNSLGLSVYEHKTARARLHPPVCEHARTSIVCWSECLVLDSENAFFSEAEPSTFSWQQIVEQNQFNLVLQPRMTYGRIKQSSLS